MNRATCRASWYSRCADSASYTCLWTIPPHRMTAKVHTRRPRTQQGRSGQRRRALRAVIAELHQQIYYPKSANSAPHSPPYVEPSEIADPSAYGRLRPSCRAMHRTASVRGGLQPAPQQCPSSHGTSRARRRWAAVSSRPSRGGIRRLPHLCHELPISARRRARVWSVLGRRQDTCPLWRRSAGTGNDAHGRR